MLILINGTDFLDNKFVRTPIGFYLLKRMEDVIDGRRFIFVMDEFWKWLLDEAFRDFAFNKLKTIRKQNGFGIFATQSPSDVLGSDIAKAVIEQSATQIFLPNPKADEKEYTEGFKVTEAEFMWIKSLKESTDNIELTELLRAHLGEDPADWLTAFQDIKNNPQIIKQLQSSYGVDPELWLPVYLENRNNAE